MKTCPGWFFPGNRSKYRKVWKMEMKLSFKCLVVLASLTLLVSASASGQTSAPPSQSGQTLPNVIRIGATLPLTGSAAAWGKLASQAMNQAAEEINGKGGILGHQIQVVYEDHRAEAQLGAVAFRKLAEVDHIPVILTMNSGPVLAQIPIARETKSVLFDAGTVSPQVRQGGHFVVSNVPKADVEAPVHAKLVYNVLGVKKAGIVRRKDEAGTNFANEVRNAYKQLGGEIVFDEAHDPDATDFRVLLLKLKQSGATVVFVPTYYAEGANILRQAVQLGVDVTWVSYSNLLNPAFSQLLGDAAKNTKLLATSMGWDPTDPTPKTQAFISTYKSKYGQEPDFYSANSYDGVYLIAGAIERCACYNSDGIVSALLSGKEYLGVTGPTSFDKDGMAVKPVKWWRLAPTGMMEAYTPKM